jgi:hypothetical protein
VDTSRPFLFCRIISFCPGPMRAMTGVEQAIASNRTKPWVLSPGYLFWMGTGKDPPLCNN